MSSGNLGPYSSALAAPPGGLRERGGERGGGGESLVDVLDRVLDKGVVIAGDIRINLLDIELLTIKVRLLIASADKAREMGIDWWAHDPQLNGKARQQQQQLDGNRDRKALEDRVERLETKLDKLLDRLPAPTSTPAAAPAKTKGS